MLYLCFALYPEAKAFLEKFNLKKQHQYTKYQVFEGENVCCVLMGVGPMKTAIHLSHFLPTRELKEEDIFVNIGFAGTKDKRKKIGEFYFIHKIHSHDSGRDFYPELLYRQIFPETTLESFSKVVLNKRGEVEDKIEGDLLDMEGAAFFETLSFFVKRRQIFLYKCVSDFLEGGKIESDILSKELMKESMKKSIDSLVQFFLSFSENSNLENSEENLQKKEQEIGTKLVKHFFCTASMEVQLRELLHFASCKGIDIEKILEDAFKQEIASKSEGKKYVENLRKTILEF